jgi:hypothetical protein
MQRHISPVAKQRISDFFTQEDGNVGRKNALMAGTVLSSVMLAATLFGPGAAKADDIWCSEWDFACGQIPDNYTCCSLDQDCCKVPVAGGWEFFCTYGDCPK